MHTHFKSVAASAVAIVLIFASTSFVVFQMMAHPDSSAVSNPISFSPIVNMLSAAAKMWLIAAIAGAWMWIIMFASRRSGIHRLAQVSTVAKHRQTFIAER